ncbi:alpha-E domain-containing protein [Alkalicoccobacillus plakortidis]|uniref:Alpha-E domain-containing protein n=1 Tax=Alkalicoccobacillus plakortidis TaxID=444060 RepID=A0ABT0XMV3_9BACI|nr:alpha-E domain-containing protein [Alkalicoccobacillus plakortidis]MCM2677152.1 alpha-E domain-containing protein [Alkalicoccobacillus plakortidis]
MLLRVADSLYWMARNIERAENHAHVLSVELIQALEASDEDLLMNEEWDVILDICAAGEERKNLMTNGSPDLEKIIRHLTFSADNPSSTRTCIQIARENARKSRDHLSNDLWMILNECYLYLIKWSDANWSNYHIQSTLQRVKMTSLSVQGVIETTASRGVDYRLIKIGFWIERADHTLRILRSICKKLKEQPQHTTYYLNLALQLSKGSDAYLRGQLPYMRPQQVFSFLMINPDFPRSIRYCIDHAWYAIKQVEGDQGSGYAKHLKETLTQMTDSIQSLELGSLEVDYMLDFFRTQYSGIKVT